MEPTTHEPGSAYKTGIPTEGVENRLLRWPVNEVPGSLRGVTSKT